MKTEPAREPLLDLERPAVVDGESDVVGDIEIAEFREYPSGQVGRRRACRLGLRLGPLTPLIKVSVCTPLSNPVCAASFRACT